jgi:large subunit ribosomal protein L22
MIDAQATAKYIRTSAQKAGLVLEQIRGCAVNQALATLRFSRKRVARDIDKVLRSAIANAQQKPGFGGDVESLFVSACYAGQGPSQKRVRPAPMGRAYRVVKRTAHLTVKVSERADAVRVTKPVDRTKTAADVADTAAPTTAARPRARKGTKQAGGGVTAAQE